MKPGFQMAVDFIMVTSCLPLTLFFNEIIEKKIPTLTGILGKKVHGLFISQDQYQ
jgi:hypothetical protein